MRLFKRILIAIWILPFPFGILIIHGPKSVTQLLIPVVPFLVVLFLFSMIGTVVYVLIRVYQVGIQVGGAGPGKK